MEDSTSNTLQDIEKLKQKISGYRDTLMSLKMGSSFEDYLIMKKEFDVLKMQISYIEDLTKTMDEKQNTQNEIYEEQIKQFAFQLSWLHQTVEQMSQEISKLIIIKDKDEEDEYEEDHDEAMLKDDTAPTNEENNTGKPRIILKRMDRITPPSGQTSTVSNGPSFIQLRNFSRPLLKQQNEQENLISVEQNEHKVNAKDPHYIQLINTVPNNVRNGLHNNTVGKPPIQFERSTEVQYAPTSDLGKGYHFSRLTNEIEKVNKVPSTTVNNKSVNTSIPPRNEPTNESVTTSITSESNYTGSVKEQKNHFLHGLPIEKINQNAKSSDGEIKKHKNSFFNNIFRK